MKYILIVFITTFGYLFYSEVFKSKTLDVVNKNKNINQHQKSIQILRDPALKKDLQKIILSHQLNDQAKINIDFEKISNSDLYNYIKTSQLYNTSEQVYVLKSLNEIISKNYSAEDFYKIKTLTLALIRLQGLNDSNQVLLKNIFASGNQVQTHSQLHIDLIQDLSVNPSLKSENDMRFVRDLIILRDNSIEKDLMNQIFINNTDHSSIKDETENKGK